MLNFADLAAEHGEWVVAVAGRKGQSQSGFHFRDGWVFTTEHGLNGDDAPAVALPNGERIASRLIGRDPGSDLALLKVEAALPTPVARADVNGIRPGEPVLALARDPDDGLGVSFGVISCRAGEWRSWRGGSIEHFLQPDLSLYKGYAGGPLIDLEGRLLGLLTPALARSAPIALTVPTLERLARQLQERHTRGRAYLGLGLQGVELRGQEQACGAMLISLAEGGPAEVGGLLLGDILVALAGHEVGGTDDVLAVLAGLAGDELVTVALIRAGQPLTLELRTGRRTG